MQVNFKRGDFPTRNTVPGATYHIRIAKAEIRAPQNVELPPDVNDPDLDLSQIELPDEAFLNLTVVIQDEEHLGRHLFQNVPLNPAAERSNMTRSLLDAIQYPEDEPLAIGQLIDAECLAVVTEGKDQQGEPKNFIRKFLPIQ
jgi:hypothetical protein